MIDHAPSDMTVTRPVSGKLDIPLPAQNVVVGLFTHRSMHSGATDHPANARIALLLPMNLARQTGWMTFGPTPYEESLTAWGNGKRSSALYYL